MKNSPSILFIFPSVIQHREYISIFHGSLVLYEPMNILISIETTGTPKVELDISNDTHPHLILHYKSIINGLGEQFSIVNAIAHALGHLFGLEHSKDSHSVMFAGHPRMNSMSLGADVEKRVQNLMGFCQVKLIIFHNTLSNKKYFDASKNFIIIIC